jgi:O-antigen/teichoic acid export membrane protein
MLVCAAVTFARQSLGSLAVLVFGLAVSILLPRVLGAEARGEYQLAVKLAALVLAVAQWGIPEVLLQHVAERRSALGALVGTSMALGLAGAVATAVVLAVLSPLLRDNLLRGVEPALLTLTLGGSLAALVGLLARRFIQLDGRLAVYNWLDIGRTLLFLMLIAVGGVLAPRQAIVPTWAWLFGEVGVAVTALAYLARGPAKSREWKVDGALGSDLMRSGAPIQLGLLAMFIGSEGGAFVLNANVDIAAVGIYSVALSISRLLLQISMALRTALQPRLVGSEADSAAVTARVTRHGLLWMLIAAVCLAIGSPLIPTIFTAEFASAAPLLLVLLPGMVGYGVWQLLAGHLLRIGRRGFLAATAWLFALVSIGLQAAAIQSFGLVGAALGLSLAYLVATAIVLVGFLRASGRSARELVPVPGDLAFYVGLTRRALAAHG